MTDKEYYKDQTELSVMIVVCGWLGMIFCDTVLTLLGIPICFYGGVMHGYYTAKRMRLK